MISMKEIENKKLKSDEILINYVDEGSGTTLLFLHGNLVSHHYFKKEILEFKNRFRVVAPDTRGHGQSSFGSGPVNLDTLSDDLHTLIKSLDLKDIVLIGHSDGANIALKYLTKYDDVIGAVSLSGNISPKGLFRIPYLFFEMIRKITHFLGRFNEKYRERSILLSLITESQNISMEDLKKIKVPVLYVVGSKDIIDINHTNKMVTNTPKGSLYIAKGVGHHVLKNYLPAEKLIEEFANSLIEK